MIWQKKNKHGEVKEELIGWKFKIQLDYFDDK